AYVAEIAKTLLGLADLSEAEFQRIAMSKGWPLSKGPEGLWEARAPYPVVLDRVELPPIILCPLIGTEDISRATAREFIHTKNVSATSLLSDAIGPPEQSFTWAPQKWGVSIWSGNGGVAVSLEETDYEVQGLPLLVIACDVKDAQAIREH